MEVSSRERVCAALSHKQPDRIPLDCGSTGVTGMHVSCVAALRDYLGLEKRPVKVIDPGAMIGEVDDEIKTAFGIDTEFLFKRMTRFGFPAENWKPWRTYEGLEVLVPGGFNVTVDERGDTLMHPLGDTSLPPSSRMPAGGFFFDSIIRQHLIDDDKLNPADNLEEFGPISEEELAHLERRARTARETGRAVVASFGGTSFGDIALVPGAGLPDPKGIRDITEWYVSTRSRREYIHAVFNGQCEIALENLKRIAARLGDFVDVVYICGTDFGTQSSSFCSVATFRELWMPYYQRVNNWIHANTGWKTFKHSCGAVEKFIPSLVESGFDILNPVQCSAAGMDPEVLKQRYGRDIVFWGGGVDTQKVLPFESPDRIREQVLRRCEIFAPDGGFVFAAIHDIQALTPVENLVAMFRALRSFGG